jgi:hypothetical protein
MSDGSASAQLAATLLQIGIACTVESRGTLAVVVVDEQVLELLAGQEQRHLVQRLARKAGFTHVAVELGRD